MKVTRTDIAHARSEISNYKYALLYKLSEIVLKACEDISDRDWDECTEARFFNEKGELHVVCGEDAFAVIVTDEDGDDFIIREYEIEAKHRTMGSRLYVKHYLDKDEDGQEYIVLTRLAGIRQEN